MTIPVFCSYSELVDPEKLIPHPKNPNKHPQKQIELLAKIINAQGWRAPITVSKRSGFVIRGHGRLLAALKLGLKEVPIDKQDYETEAEEWADLIADNRIAELSKMDSNILAPLLKELKVTDSDMELTAFDEKEIEKLLKGYDIKEEAKETNQKEGLTNYAFADEFTLEPEIQEALLKKRVTFMFSGGRDSALTVFLMLPFLRENKKEFELLYVDTGVEFPGLQDYVVRFSNYYNAPLKILKSKNDFFQYYEKKKSFPSPAFRDCIGVMINETVDAYNFSFDDQFITVRGGRKKQTTQRSKGEKFYSLIKNKKEVQLLNPLFDLSQEAYEKYLSLLEKDFGIWEGYKLGFVRTACWCCPFQTKQQYDAIRKHLPMCWEVLKRKAFEWKTFGSEPGEEGIFYKEALKG